MMRNLVGIGVLIGTFAVASLGMSIAQPVPPALDAGFAAQAILALQQQRNAAQDSAAQASAQLALSQQKVIELQAQNKSLQDQLDKAKAAAVPATPVPPQTAVPSEQGK